MPSPFPGMDPYLENPAYWPDFHARFITYCCDEIAEELPQNYEARIDERVSLVDISSGEFRKFLPDVAITQKSSRAPKTGVSAGALVLEPVTLPLELSEEVRETRIEILHRPDRNLVAVLELLSPTNKTDLGSGVYHANRRALLEQPVHLVELDFLAGGRRLHMRRPLPPGHYYAIVSRHDRRPDCEVYAWTVSQPLPAIPVPLKAPDPDLELNLAQVFSITYERGRYARSLDYKNRPAPDFSAEDLQWIAGRAAKKN